MIYATESITYIRTYEPSYVLGSFEDIKILFTVAAAAAAVAFCKKVRLISVAGNGVCTKKVANLFYGIYAAWLIIKSSWHHKR